MLSKNYHHVNINFLNCTEIELTSTSGCDNQRILEEVEATNMSDTEYDEILAFGRKKSRDEGIDKTMAENDVNIIVGPSDSNLFVLSALSGMFDPFFP